LCWRDAGKVVPQLKGGFGLLGRLRRRLPVFSETGDRSVDRGDVSCVLARLLVDLHLHIALRLLLLVGLVILGENVNRLQRLW
jgi:hypothetical protein